MNSSMEDPLNTTPGFQEKCLSHHTHSENHEEEDEMVEIINQNENKIQEYENFRNNFIYKILIAVEDYQEKYCDQLKESTDTREKMNSWKNEATLAKAKLKSS
jgi:hypothetical protein